MANVTRTIKPDEIEVLQAKLLAKQHADHALAEWFTYHGRNEWLGDDIKADNCSVAPAWVEILARGDILVSDKLWLLEAMKIMPIEDAMTLIRIPLDAPQ